MEPGSDALGLIGTTIAEKYAVESVVGEGGFAVVYRATHIVWKRPVAVKIFKALGEVAKTERQRLLDDFIQEGALLADLSERSTAICQARDVGMLTTPSGDVVPYMVLEWLEGKPLEAVLEGDRATNAPLRSLEETIRLLDPIAEALALAHKKGIAHRDVKPANIFVIGDPRGSDLSVKLLDFGIAKVVQDAQKMGFGKTAGHITSFTPSYGSPEQFNRSYGATGPWTDVFALALVTVEVLSGREPLPGDTIVQLAYAASDPARRPTPRTFGVATSDEVEAVFQKALAVSTTDRYQTAGELWNALRMAAIGTPMAGVPSTRSLPSPVQAPQAYAATAMAPGAVAAGGTVPAFAQPQAAAPAPTAATMKVGEAAPTDASAKKSNMPVVVGGVVLLGLAAAAVGVFALGRKTVRTDATPSATSPAVSAPSSTPSVTAAPAKTCPAGMKLVAGGQFFMGSDEKDAEANEKPPHRVQLAAFCLDEFEVSVAKYKACSDQGACLRAAKENEWDGITALQHKLYDPLCNITDPVNRANHPINCVSWEQSRKYCEAQDARLPTEAEWEFAARGSDGRIYPWGDAKPTGQHLNACGKECVAWMKKHRDPDQPIAAMYPEDDGFATTAPVGSFPKGASSWGIQDIVGNVWEWVGDWYADYDAASASSITTQPNGPEKGEERVIRGGAWNGSDPAWVRPAWRFRASPTTRSHGTGFRCAKSL